jgi:hypothetical protein
VSTSCYFCHHERASAREGSAFRLCRNSLSPTATSALKGHGFSTTTNSYFLALKGHGFYKLRKNSVCARFVSGHDFSRADKSFLFSLTGAGFSRRQILIADFFRSLF